MTDDCISTYDLSKNGWIGTTDGWHQIALFTQQCTTLLEKNNFLYVLFENNLKEKIIKNKFCLTSKAISLINLKLQFHP